MTLQLKSKREHCKNCNSTKMQNFILMEPGEDLRVFVECSECQEFVARYTLKFYTCEDPYRSFLRRMRHQRMSSGPAAAKASKAFSETLWEKFGKAKELAAAHEENRELEDILDEWDKDGDN
ncbi:MAG: hypothetical protein GY835_05880 [bacterium]|nr:hypothetical protein [bacterium]